MNISKILNIFLKNDSALMVSLPILNKLCSHHHGSHIMYIYILKVYQCKWESIDFDFLIDLAR